MKKNLSSLFTFILFSLFSCASEEQRIVDSFVKHARSLNIAEIKQICSDDTNFYIRMTLEPLVNLGESNYIEELKKIASTVECHKEGGRQRCTYIDQNGKVNAFEVRIVYESQNKSEPKMLVHIDKSYFLGD